MTENEISYRIRGAIFKVYNALGPGLLESIYISRSIGISVTERWNGCATSVASARLL